MQVVSLPERNRRDPKDADRRRMAIQLAAQLPENPAEALLVLEATTLLVKAFLMPDGL